MPKTYEINKKLLDNTIEEITEIASDDRRITFQMLNEILPEYIKCACEDIEYIFDKLGDNNIEIVTDDDNLRIKERTLTIIKNSLGLSSYKEAPKLLKRIRRLLASLSQREEKIIRLRYGIGEKASYTLEEIAQRFNVSPERIAQIETNALDKISDMIKKSGGWRSGEIE